ncbi:hypothetical protein C723_2361 [Christiangramia flava JLT2011]|uniref:Uncharacterized protein n=1 Tax=Christiangramia flava JLT2011 TaxID=1229726 RepID=A0A1L7I051_9FLAO|nr:hypothetical protein GRFL_0247 [Christiangramia flava JLT2011]OSS38643.1 hypothetical protein C723_2361 [Christiangramia flava JLT2011]
MVILSYLLTIGRAKPGIGYKIFFGITFALNFHTEKFHVY